MQQQSPQLKMSSDREQANVMMLQDKTNPHMDSDTCNFIIFSRNLNTSIVLYFPILAMYPFDLCCNLNIGPWVMSMWVDLYGSERLYILITYKDEVYATV